MWLASTMGQHLFTVGNRLVSQILVSLVACRQGSYDNCAKCYMFLNIKRNIFWSVLHIPTLWCFDTSVTYPNDFDESNSFKYCHVFLLRENLWNIAMQPAVVCYNSWANIRCSGCSPSEEISLWNGTISSCLSVPRREDFLSLKRDTVPKLKLFNDV